MRRLALVVVLALLAALPASTQHGTAESGYWPMGYMGDMWTGVVTSTNSATREITLTFTKGKKTETFTGVLQEGYTVKMKDGTSRELPVSTLVPGTRITVYYMPKQKKEGDKKIKYYEIFKIQFLALPEGPSKATPQ